MVTKSNQLSILTNQYICNLSLNAPTSSEASVRYWLTFIIIYRMLTLNVMLRTHKKRINCLLREAIYEVWQKFIVQFKRLYFSPNLIFKVPM